MKPHVLGSQPADLAEVRSQFDLFRAQRKHGTRIPPELYADAAALLDRYPEVVVCSELGLDRERFRRRRGAGSTRQPSAADSKKRARRGSPATQAERAPLFVELPSLPSATHGCRTERTGRDLRVVVDNAYGLRLTLSASAEEWSSIEPFLRSVLITR